MEDVVKRLIAEKILTSGAVIDAFNKIKREDFLPQDLRVAASVDQALPIGFSQTNSQPMTVALMFEWLGLERGDRVLDVGSGSGWTAALGAQIIGPGGKVYGLEIIPELVDFAKENIDKYGFLKEGRVEIVRGDGNSGLPEKAPFDRIMVSAAALEVPADLKEQLKIGGRLIIPLGLVGESQDLALIDKIGKNEFKETRYPGFIFVPLVRK